MKLRSKSVPKIEAGLIARCPLPHTSEKSVSTSGFDTRNRLARAPPAHHLKATCSSDINIYDKPRLQWHLMTTSAASISFVSPWLLSIWPQPAWKLRTEALSDDSALHNLLLDFFLRLSAHYQVKGPATISVQAAALRRSAVVGLRGDSTWYAART
jgi:hypothetical protein